MKNYRTRTIKFLHEYSLDLLVGFILASCFLFFISYAAKAQNVGINNPIPHTKSLLDLTSTDKGLLTPRMTEAQRTAMFPAADASAKGMLVYQTDNAQGFYYYDGIVWQVVTKGNEGWGLTGNSGTSAATNFLGTTDNNPVVLKSNNKEQMRLLPTDKVGIGTATPGIGYSSARVEIADETGANSDFAMRTAGGGYPVLVFESSNGTLAAPSVSSNGAWGGVLIGQVYDGTQYINTSAMIFGTEGANSVGNVAGTIQFNTNHNGPNGNEKMRISSIGNLGVGVVNPLNRLDVGGNVNVIADSNYRIGNARVLSIKGGYNLFVGANTGLSNTGGYNAFVGSGAGNANTSGGSNAFFGHFAGLSNLTGSFNTYLGNNAALANTSGSGNVSIGSHSNFSGTSGANNVFVGMYSGLKNADSNNVFVGWSAGYNNTDGTGNLFMGYNSGTFNSTGSNNTYLGQNANGAATINNSGAIGSKAYVALSNSIVLGDTGVNIGINQSSPLYPLSFRNTLGDKISFWGGAGGHYGIGIQNYLLQIHSGGANDDIAFGYGSSAVFTERMRIKGNGNVGIGTSTPTAKLDVAGTLKITDGTQAAGKVLTSDATGLATWQTINATTVSAWGLNGNAGTNAATNFIGTTDATDLMFRTSGIGRMTISATGNFGVGMNPIAGSKFSVYNLNGECMSLNGGAQFNGLSAYVGGSGFINSGVHGQNTGTGCGVQGISSVTSGYSIGVRGASMASTGIGVEGVAADAAGINYGVKASTASAAGYSGHFTGGKFYVGTGNAGFGTIAPATQVEIEGALTLGDDATLIANAPTFNITVGNRSYYRINSNATPASRLISLTNGLQVGQILMIECTATGGVNGIRMSDTPATFNTNLGTFHDMYENDIITLIWNGIDWIETAYSNN